MLKRSLAPLLMLAILLSACQSQAPVSPPPTAPLATPSPQFAVAANPTAAAKPPATASPVAAVTSAPPGCTVISPQPTLGPTETSLFPPISDKDWVIGAPTATVSIIEYSDFQ
jgi:protein-disulfide isomerase